jgi:hypothetical protein
MPPSTGDDALFVYGSLLFPEVQRALLDRAPSQIPATAPGWRAAALPEKVYPGLVVARDSATGLLLTGLTADDWRTLTAFEGDLYDLRRLTLAAGRLGWAFVWRGVTPASPQDWSPADFAARVLPSFVEGCLAWRRRYLQSQAATRSAGR